MSIGNQIMSIRRERQLTQEQFGSLFHVTRQTVSNWENGKSYHLKAPVGLELLPVANISRALQLLARGQ